MEDNTFGEKLKAAREQHGLTRVQLAEQIGSSSKTIARWERGETLPRPQFEQKLCDTLDTTPSSDTTFIKHSNLRSRGRVLILDDWKPPLLTETKREPNPIDIERNEHLLFQLVVCLFDSPLRLRIIGSIGDGKSTALNSLLDLEKQEETTVQITDFGKHSPLDIVLHNRLIDKASHALIATEVLLSTQASRNTYLQYVEENLVALHRYFLITNFYGIILPNLFTVPLQLDVGGIVTGMTNAALTIHQILSDPSWQGIAVVLSLAMSVYAAYKKKSSMVASFFAPNFLAA